MLPVQTMPIKTFRQTFALLALSLVCFPIPSLASGILVVEDETSGCFLRQLNHDTCTANSGYYVSKSRRIRSGDVLKLRAAVLASRNQYQELSPSSVGIDGNEIAKHEQQAIAAASRFLNEPVEKLPKAVQYDDVRRAVQMAVLMGRVPNTTKRKVLIQFEEVPAITISSSSFVPSMVPWEVQVGQERWQTFSPDMGSQISKLLSPSSPNFKLTSSGRDYWMNGFWNDDVVWGKTLKPVN